MVGVEGGRIGILGLNADFTYLISNGVRGGKGTSRLVNCMFLVYR